MAHGVLRLGGEWVASRKRHWPAWCWSSGAEVTMGSGASGSLGVWPRCGLQAGCVRDELFPPPRPGWEQPSSSHALMAVLCRELCGLESRIQLFDMAARRILEASFEKSAVPSGPRAGPSSSPPLWRGRDISAEPGPPGAPD